MTTTKDTLVHQIRIERRTLDLVTGLRAKLYNDLDSAQSAQAAVRAGRRGGINEGAMPTPDDIALRLEYNVAAQRAAMDMIGDARNLARARFQALLDKLTLEIAREISMTETQLADAVAAAIAEGNPLQAEGTNSVVRCRMAGTLVVDDACHVAVIDLMTGKSSTGTSLPAGSDQ
jgi:hypothetical protein